jgi:hypothetical protein
VYNPVMMTFREARRRITEALQAGNFQHEYREVVEGKNLLDTGEVTPAEVVDLLRRCRGDQHERRSHHFDESILVHIFQPIRGDERWYIKVYIIEGTEEAEADAAVFVSVHKSQIKGRGKGKRR